MPMSLCSNTSIKPIHKIKIAVSGKVCAIVFKSELFAVA